MSTRSQQSTPDKKKRPAQDPIQRLGTKKPKGEEIPMELENSQRTEKDWKAKYLKKKEEAKKLQQRVDELTTLMLQQKSSIPPPYPTFYSPPPNYQSAYPGYLHPPYPPSHHATPNYSAPVAYSSQPVAYSQTGHLGAAAYSVVSHQ